MRTALLVAALCACTPADSGKSDLADTATNDGSTATTTPTGSTGAGGTGGTGSTTGGTGTGTGSTGSGTGSPTTGTGSGTGTGTGTSTGTGTATGTGTGTGTTSTPPAPITWDVGRTVVCDDPGQRNTIIFDNEALDTVDVLHPYHWGGGVTLRDFDDDGVPELIRTTETGVLMYARVGDAWVDVTAERLPELPELMVANASAADVDGDGDADLLLLAWEGSNHLLRNDGGVFVDVTDDSGLHRDRRLHQTGAWGDADGDGDLDLFIGAYGYTPPADPATPTDPSALYLNDGDGRFVDATDVLPDQVHDGYTFQGTWIDSDRDGDQDLILLNDFPYREVNQFLVNDGALGLVHDDGAAYGADISGMGMEVGDLNADGVPDYVITAYQEVAILLSYVIPDHGVTFIRTDDAWGVDPIWRMPEFQEFAWGVGLGDLDNDGDEDIMVAFGDATDPDQHDAGRHHWRAHRDGLWENRGAGLFEDRATEWGVASEGIGRGLVMADWNRDGWLDLVLAELNGPTTVRTARCGEGHWLAVDLRDERTPNTFAIGAIVEVIGPERTWTEWVTAGSTSMYSDGPPEVHVGLGAVDVVNVRVTWPDGEVSDHADLPVDQRLSVTRHAD